jgi:hypothetical protein
MGMNEAKAAALRIRQIADMDLIGQAVANAIANADTARPKASGHK